MTRNESDTLVSEIKNCLTEFWKEYPTEKHCVEGMFQAIFPDGNHTCKRCNHHIQTRNFGSRVVVCDGCMLKNSFTADTVFHGAQRLLERFAMLWLLGKGVKLTASLLEKVFNIPASTAWYIFHSVNEVFSYQMKERFRSVHANAFRDVVWRRCKSSPASRHPAAELDNDGEEGTCIEYESFSDNGSPEIDDQSSRTQDELSSEIGVETEPADRSSTNDCPCSEDSILSVMSDAVTNFETIRQQTGLDIPALSAALTMLELNGQIVRSAGDNYSKVRKSGNYMATGSSDPELMKTVALLSKELHKLSGGVSLRYLQSYLTSHWLASDRQSWSLATLLRSSLSFKKFSLEIGIQDRMVSVYSPEAIFR